MIKDYQFFDIDLESAKSCLQLDEKILNDIYTKRISEINNILSEDRQPIPVAADIKKASATVQAILYYEYCAHLGLSCNKQMRCLWQMLVYGTSASTAEQVFRTSLTAKYGVHVELLNDNTEIIYWRHILTNSKHRIDRRHLSNDQFDSVIISQNGICWGYTDKDNNRHTCTAIVSRGNGNTEQGHQPSVNETVVVAQCRSCNRSQTWGDKEIYEHRNC